MKFKTTIAFLIIGLMTISVASAAEWLPPSKYRCEIIRPATEYRAEKSFGLIGVFGRFSDGSVRCFLPEGKHKKAVPKPNNGGSEGSGDKPPVCHSETSQVCLEQQVCTTIYEETCHPEQNCQEECHKEKSWKGSCYYDKHHKEHCNYGWVWSDVCKQVCTTHQECNTTPVESCHLETSCHDETKEVCI